MLREYTLLNVDKVNNYLLVVMVVMTYIAVALIVFWNYKNGD